MRKTKIIGLFVLVILAGILALFFLRKSDFNKDLNISNPFGNAFFPPEFPAPKFEWWSEIKETSSYDISVFTLNKKYSMKATTAKPFWTPSESAWDSLKLLSEYGRICFTVKRSGSKEKPSKVIFSISTDSVGAPVLYRQMPIPFLLAEKSLDSMNFMLINFGSRKQPHIVMRGFPVCGNCHSITFDGRLIGLDLDAGLRDKGGYFVSPIKDTIFFNVENYTSWSRLEKRRTFGLFSKVSPDGRFVVTTVKDRVVMKNTPITDIDKIAYSQLFFPVNGHLAIYDRETKILKELPGANSDEYVQSNAIWTPDGKNIIFSRAKALPRDSDIYEIDVKNEKVVDQYVSRQKEMKYDLYIIPFNNGDGGKAEPLKGASDNGMSNYFPAISPDGKWIIFCQAENFMLLQPDSRLFIVPAKGGKARELQCNFNSMNSWHSWSPNSKWIVYVSKVLGPYTNMYLSHIDEKGNASIPVLVEKASKQFRVVNYPEFVNRNADETFVMDYDFVELAHINKAIKAGDIEKAKQLYHKLERQGLYLFKEDCEDLSFMLKRMGLPEEVKKYDELAKHTINTFVFQR